MINWAGYQLSDFHNVSMLESPQAVFNLSYTTCYKVTASVSRQVHSIASPKKTSCIYTQSEQYCHLMQGCLFC